MFGKPSQPSPPSVPGRPKAADVARIQGGGLVQLIVNSLTPMNFYLFLNDQAVSQMDVESLSISIEAPSDSTSSTVVRATLTRHVDTVTGAKTMQSSELFPCTLEIIALGRRLAMTCSQADSLEGLWVDLGLKPDGTGNELSGLRGFRFLLTDGILDAKVTWEDGETEDILPQP